MIKIGNGTDWLVLNPGTKLSFEFNNASFDYDVIPGSLVWNFTIPTTQNSKLLDFAHFIELKNKRRLYKSWKIIALGKEIQGTLVVQKPGSIEYQCNFLVNGFSGEDIDRNLEEYDWGADEILGTNAESVKNFATTQITKTWPAVNYNFAPHKNILFYNTNIASFTGILNRWDMSANEFMINYIDGSNNVINQTALVPWPYLCFVVEQFFKAIGYRVTGNFFTHPEIKKLLVCTNYGLDKKYDLYGVKATFVGALTVTAPDPGTQYETIPHDDDSSTGNYDNSNLWNAATFRYQIPRIGHYRFKIRAQITVIDATGWLLAVSYTDGVPAPLPIYTDNDAQMGGPFWTEIETVQEAIAINVGGYFVMQAIATNGTIIVHEATVTIVQEEEQQLNRYATSLHMANHVPQMTGRDFIKALRNIPNLRTSFDPLGKLVSFNFSEDVFDRKALDWTNKAAKEYESETSAQEGFKFNWDFQNEGLAQDNFTDLSALNNLGDYDTREELPSPLLIDDIAFVKNINKYVITAMDDGLGILVWNNCSDNFSDYNIGSGGTEIKPAAYAMLMDAISLEGGKGICPVTQGLGSSPAFDVGINKTGLRLCLWHGIQAGFGGNYPLASSYNYDYNGNIIGNLSLRWDEPFYGIYALFWKRWIEFIRDTEPVYRQFDLTFEDIASFTFEQMRRVQMVESVIKKLTADLDTETGQIDSEMEMYKKI